jgi:hypothetical protein
MSRQHLIMLTGIGLLVLLFGGGTAVLLAAERHADYPGASLTDRYRRFSPGGQPLLRSTATFTTTDTPRQIRDYYDREFGLVDGNLAMPQCVLLTSTTRNFFFDHRRNVTFCEASQGRTLLVEDVFLLR